MPERERDIEMETRAVGLSAYRTVLELRARRPVQKTFALLAVIPA